MIHPDPAAIGSPPAATPPFETETLNACRVLEAWRKDEQAIIEYDPNELPGTDWRLAARGVVLFGLGAMVVVMQSQFNFVQEIWSLGLYLLLLAISGGTGFVILLQAQGFFEARFWRAFWMTFKSSDNYPFTSLIRRTERDFAAIPLLTPFGAEVLETVEQRIAVIETELRERLTLLGGNSAIPTIVSLVVGVWSAWKALWSDLSAIAMVALAGAVLVLCVVVYSLRLRMSLLELSRCRALLSLELARRKSSAGGASAEDMTASRISKTDASNPS